MNSAAKAFEPVHAPQRDKSGPAPYLKELARLIHGWYQRSRQRRQPMTLPPEMLKDIGISRADAEHEGNKPFWR